MAEKRRRIYILGAGTMQLPAIRIAKGFGWEVICADGNPQAVGRDEVDGFEEIDLKDRDAIADSVVAWRRGKGLDGVFTAGTDFSAVVAYAAEKAGLPGIPYRSALMATDKVLMRRAFDAAGVTSPRFREVESLSDGREALESIDLPAVVKPVDNMGARGIRRVDRPEEYGAALEEALRNSRSGRAIVEEYLDGPEFSLDALIYRGEFVLCGLADRHIRFAPYFVEIGHTMPSTLSGTDREAVVGILRQGAAALGIDNGAAKGDIKLTREGPVVGEIAARLSGGYMSGWTYPLASGVEVTAGALRIAVGEHPGGLEPLRNHTAAERAFYSIPGKISAIDGFSVEDVAAGFLTVKPGERVIFPTNNVQKCGNFITADPERERACAAAEAACRRVLIRLEPGDAETASFLDGGNGSWIPAAYTLEREANRRFLDALSAEPDLEDIRRRGVVIPLPPEPEKGSDWLGRPFDEALALTAEIFGADTAPSGNTGAGFWRAFLRGGWQGGLWYLETRCREGADEA